jgi:flagellar hook-associated protein 1 FlgK
MSELLKLGSTALLGNQSQLQSISSNIANLNTPGYTRQRTEFTDLEKWGIGRPETVRLFDKFAIDQHRRDSANMGYAEKYRDNASTMDYLFSNDETSVAKGLDDVFSRLNEANDEPSALTPRQLVISDSEALVARMQATSERILEQEDVLNEELELTISEANSMLNSFFHINSEVVSSSAGEHNKAAPQLVDERNELVRKLAETLGVTTIDKDNNGLELIAPNGQGLAIDGNVFNLRALPGDPDPKRLEIEIFSVRNPNHTLPFSEDNANGKLGGLLDYRREVLDETINSLGQMAIAFADSMNEQNHKGVDLEGKLGGDMFSIPSTKALGYQDNSSEQHNIEVRIEAGLGGQVSNFEYEIEFTTPTEYTIQTLQHGENLGSNFGPFTIPGATTDFQGQAAGLPDGLEMRFEPDAAFTAGDRFLVRPTRLAGLEIEMNFNRPKQLALAAPISLENPKSNLGNGELKLEDITNTDTDNTLLNQSGFTNDVNGDGTLGDFGLDDDAPAKVIFTLAGEYDVQDSLGNSIAVLPSGNNIMEQIRNMAPSPWPAATHGTDYPGYEISVEGTAKAGDEFNITYNDDAFNDNFNGLKLADLQSDNTMRRNILAGGDTLTFAESYSNLIGYVGDTANRANIDFTSAESLLEQSKIRVDDVSGVNLDQEAANLVKFEQAYNASARIITIAQQTFDTILQAVR